MLDLNSSGLMAFRSQPPLDSKEPVFGMEDITELVIYSLNVFYLQCKDRRAALYVFDEKTTQLIFPLNPSDESLISFFDFAGIKRVVFERVLAFLDAKAPSTSRRSCLIQALFQCMCRSLNSLQPV